MAKRIMCYLKDEDLEKLGDISGADLVGLALLGAGGKECSNTVLLDRLDEIYECIKKSNASPYVNTPPCPPDTTIVDPYTSPLTGKSGFSDTSVKRSLSDKQKQMAYGIIKTLLDEVTNEGFKNGDDYTHRFESMYTWLQGDVRDYVIDVVKANIEGMQHIDFTQFKWN